MVILAVLHSFVLALVAYVAFNTVESLAIWSAISFRQLNTPDLLQGRVNVVGRMAALAASLLGAAGGGVIAQLTSVRTALLVMSLGLAASTIGGWLGPLRTSSRTTSA